VIDWNALLEEAVREGFRNAGSIIVAASTGIAIVLTNWRQNLKTRKVVMDGFERTATQAGELKALREAHAETMALALRIRPEDAPVVEAKILTPTTVEKISTPDPRSKKD